MKLLARWLIAIIALGVAVWIVPGITIQDDMWLTLAVCAVILGLVNAIVRPILRLISMPITAMTLGLFLFVINGITLWLASWLSENVFDLGLTIDGLLPAIAGAIIVSIVTTVLSLFLHDDK